MSGPVKSLNTGPGKKRFVFKSFSQRVEEVDIDVFRSLAPVKLEPTGGSSFFHESLVAWRELNTAMEFTAIYEVLLPIVQTLPQLILHKKMIIETLLSRLQLSAIHSLQPILSLVAILSRDLSSDFIPFLPQFFGACTKLFQSGADREPDIIEQVFTAISYIFKYMQALLCKDIIPVLKATKKLRYYHRSYIQDFTAEAVSYLLRNAPVEDLIKGIRHSFKEVVCKPSSERVDSHSSLLWHTLKGPGVMLHSRAGPILRLLFDNSTLKRLRKKDPGGQVLVKVFSETFRHVCEELNPKAVSVVLVSLLDELNYLLDQDQTSSFRFENNVVIDTKCSKVLCQKSSEDSTDNSHKKENVAMLLYLLNDLLEFKKGNRITDFMPVFDILQKLLQSEYLNTDIKETSSVSVPAECLNTEGEFTHENLKFQILRLLLGLVKSHNEVRGTSTGPSAIVSRAASWDQIWNCVGYSSLLYLVRGLIEEETVIIRPFLPYIFRTFDEHITLHFMDILPLMMNLFGKLGESSQSLLLKDLQTERIVCFIVSVLEESIHNFKQMNLGTNEPAMLWGILKCYSYFAKFQKCDQFLAWNFAMALDQWLSTHRATFDKDTQDMWEFILAAALSSELQVASYADSARLLPRVREVLQLAVLYKDSSHVINSIVEILDFRFRNLHSYRDIEVVPSELQEGSLTMFQSNLGSQNKLLRISTLRLLTHLEHMSILSTNHVLADPKRRKGIDGTPSKPESTTESMFEQLRVLEAAPYSLEMGRQSSALLTRLKVKAFAGKLPEEYLIPLANALVGLLRNPFKLIWEASIDCLAGLLGMQKLPIWDTFVNYLDSFQRAILSGEKEEPMMKSDSPLDTHSESLSSRFRLSLNGNNQTTDAATVAILLLQAAQKVPQVSECRTRQLIPQFLTFIGHDVVNVERFTLEEKSIYRGKTWKMVVKEWLVLLSLMKNAKSYYKSGDVKEVLLNRFLMDGDPNIQTKALECLLSWKDSYLAPYEDHLKNLVSHKLAREEMTTWNIGKESEEVNPDHRQGLVLVILRLLFPKILKTKMRLHNKAAGGVQRKVVLHFIAHLDGKELADFFILIMRPLESALKPNAMVISNGVCAWESKIKEGAKASFMEWVDGAKLNYISHKKKIGFIHMIKDVLGSFDKDQLWPYLHMFLSFSFKILQCCDSITCESMVNSTGVAAVSKVSSRDKDLRTLTFKLLSVVFEKYDYLDFSPYWDIFYAITQPMIHKIKDEGASGDSPSAIFSCFLAMSKSTAFIPVIKRETELVPNLLPLLSHKNASKSIVAAALSFIENILKFDDEEASAILLPYMNSLITNLRVLLTSQDKSSRKSSDVTRRGLHILVKVSKNINNLPDAVQLLDSLLPFLITKKKAPEEELVDVLSVLRELAPGLDVESCNRTYHYLAHLISCDFQLNVRLTLCQVLLALSKADPTLDSVAQIISDLNSMSTSTVEEIDYDRRLMAYGQFSTQFFDRITYNQALLVVSQAVHDVQLDDISIRHSASNCLSIFISFLEVMSASQRDAATSSTITNSLEHCGGVDKSTSLWCAESAKMAVQKILLPNIRKAMSTDVLNLRKEWIILLKEMVAKLYFISPLGELVSLIDSDADVDFFNNIIHIQSHRRIRAMSRFKDLCYSRGLSQGILVRIFEPLFINSLIEGKGDINGNLVQSCLEVLACIASQLKWGPYYSLLRRLIHMISSHRENEKIITRVICAVLDKFHFSSASVCEVEATVSVMETDCKDSSRADEDLALATEIDSEQNQDPCILEKMQNQLQVHILPELLKLMIPKQNFINVSVAVAVVKLLQLMPTTVMEVELPRIIQNIVNLLKNRSQAVRDEARSCLLTVLGVLGPGYVGFVIEKLQASLKRGFELHVLGFTVNAVVAKILPKLKVGDVDYCMERILDLLGNDIFEEISEEKEVEKLAFKMKETRRTGSYESMKLLAQIATFHTHCGILLKPIKFRLKNALVLKTKSKIERVLRQFALGIQLNPSLKQEHLFVFVYELIEDGITRENSVVGISLSNVQTAVSVKQNSSSGEVRESVPNQYLLTEFALHLLESHLKHNKLNKSDPSLLSMLDPMLDLLKRCLDSKYGAVLCQTLKCLCHLLALPLPSLNSLSKDLLSMVLLMAQGTGKAETQVAQACFNVLVALLKHAKEVHFTEDQLRVVLSFPVFVDLESAESNVALVLLKAIVGRKLLVPELYDIIGKVSHLMVTTHTTTIRQYCSQIMLQFLLDYPLGSKRLQQHLDFFVSNLSYEHSGGRESVLEMLHSIIMKFPLEVVDEQLDTLFLPLVMRLVNDDSNELRAMIGSVLKVLMERVSQRSKQRLITFCFTWLKGDKPQLWRAASQVLGFAVEVMKQKYVYKDETLESGVSLLKHILNVNHVEEEITSTVLEGVGSIMWQETYHILTMLEKLLKEFPDMCLNDLSEDLWGIIHLFLIHKHIWVRKVSSRLLDIYFTACCGGNNSVEANSLRTIDCKTYLLQPSRLMVLVAVLCKQLESEQENLEDMVQRNLLFASFVLYYKFFENKGMLSWMDIVNETDIPGRSRVIKSLVILKAHSWISRGEVENDAIKLKKRKRDLATQETDIMSFNVKYNGLYPVIKFLEKVALSANPFQMRAVFNLYRSFASHFGRDAIQQYLKSMLIPLYKTAECVAAKYISEDIKNLAQDVLDHIREIVGTTDFVQAYNDVRQSTKKIREEHRRLKKLRVLVDPEGHARKKLKLNAKRQAQKKKKRKQMIGLSK